MKNPNVGVGIIIADEDKVLLLRRKNVLGDGTWSTPGGYLDFGETPEQCAIREAKEETGMRVDDVSLYGITNDVFPDTDKHFITLWMKAARFEGEPFVNADYEMSEVGWFKWSDLPEPLFIPFQKIVTGKFYRTEG